jgi:hypothetical protein
MTVLVVLAALGACASDSLPDDCETMVAACRAQCERDFEIYQDAWAYQSCLRSCEPSERSQCARP